MTMETMVLFLTTEQPTLVTLAHLDTVCIFKLLENGAQ